MAPGADASGRLGHRALPKWEQGDGWRADQRAGALPALSMHRQAERAYRVINCRGVTPPKHIGPPT